MNRQPSNDLLVDIAVYGTVVKTVSLSLEGMDETIFSVPERLNITFVLKNGAVAFQSSDCPDKVCVHTGWLTRQGQMASCLPNGVSLRVRRDKPSPGDIDGFAN